MPAPLAALLAVVLVFGIAWAAMVPPGQVPDEPNHIGYTQSLAERHAFPGGGPRTLSTEEDVSLYFALRGDVSRNVLKQPAWITREALPAYCGHRWRAVPGWMLT